MKDEKSPADVRGFSVLGLGEIAIRCRDLAAMTAFYRDVIGLPVLADRGGIVFFRLENGVAGHIAVLALFDAMQDSQQPAPAVRGSTLHHLALTVTPSGQNAARSWFEANRVAYRLEAFPWIGWRGASSSRIPKATPSSLSRRSAKRNEEEDQNRCNAQVTSSAVT